MKWYLLWTEVTLSQVVAAAGNIDSENLEQLAIANQVDFPHFIEEQVAAEAIHQMSSGLPLQGGYLSMN